MSYETFKTWEQMAQDASGTPYIDQYVGNVRILVMRGPSALCAYVGLPSEHKLAGKRYDDMPLECHGGLTYGAEGDGQCRPNGWYWYGWDYGHCDDVSFDSDHSDLGCKKWQLGEVYMESIGVALQLHNLMQEQAS